MLVVIVGDVLWSMATVLSVGDHVIARGIDLPRRNIVGIRCADPHHEQTKGLELHLGITGSEVHRLMMKGGELAHLRVT